MITRRIPLLIAVGITLLTSGVARAQQGDNPLDAWKYPGATGIGAGRGGGASHMLVATTDGIDKVTAFYGKKLGIKLTPDQPGGHGLYGKDGEVWVSQDDSIQPGANSPPRPVTVRIFVQRTPQYHLTLVISAGKEKGRTHISVTHIAK